ncbi:hypothetical protein [Vibrio sp. 10N.261.51.F12]|uniref:hypothetical protein n=1 Tax=Vibrio sp. 10N.261.51.F12 TaxID=3229679 RepID=UPI003550922C
MRIFRAALPAALILINSNIVYAAPSANEPLPRLSVTCQMEPSSNIVDFRTTERQFTIVIVTATGSTIQHTVHSASKSRLTLTQEQFPIHVFEYGKTHQSEFLIYQDCVQTHI